jgi:membrane protein required for beta-lactamase induction
VKGAVDLLKWGWHNGRREQAIAMICAFIFLLLTWFVSVWFAFPNILCVVYSVAWGRGHQRGYGQAMLVAIDRRIAELEAVQETMLEELAQDHPMRRAAHQELVELRRFREGL